MAKRMKDIKDRVERRIGIVGPYGNLWTYNTFDSANEAERYVHSFWANVKGDHKLSKYKYVPVELKIKVIPS